MIRTTWLPLFPLHTVLFPQGILPLKVFDQRYVDMVRDCIKNDIPFGVVLIKSGTNFGHAAEPESIGTLAHIRQLNRQTPDVVLLNMEGGRRFRITQMRTLPDQRLEAIIQTLPQDLSISVSDIHLRCAQALKIVIDEVNTKVRSEQGSEFTSPFAHPVRLDDAGWLSNRWCEILPISLKARQKLLELDDARSRLSIVFQYLQQHKIL